jgi:hypothetical protein
MVAHGAMAVDEFNFKKYLYKPLSMRMFFASVSDRKGTKTEDLINSIKDDSLDAAQTLLNWYQDNDKFLSGAMSMMVHEDRDQDVYIGEKISLEGLDGSFYSEGIAHQWTYGGPLIKNISVTRGFNGEVPIELKNQIFKGGSYQERI